MINLNEKMYELAKHKVEAYLENDLGCDFAQLNEHGVGKRHVWLLRDCGTVLVREDWLAFEDSEHFTLFSYYQPKTIKAAYVIEVVQIDTDDKGHPLIFGVVTPIKDYFTYYKEKHDRVRESDQVDIEVILQDDTHLELTKTAPYTRRSYYGILADLNLSDSDVKSVRYTDFRFLAS